MIRKLLMGIVFYILVNSYTPVYALTTNEDVGIAAISIVTVAGGVVVIKKIFANHARPTEEVSFFRSGHNWHEIEANWSLTKNDLPRMPSITINGEKVNVNMPEQLQQALIEKGFNADLAYQISGKLNQALSIEAVHDARNMLKKEISNASQEYIITNGSSPTVEVKINGARVYEIDNVSPGNEIGKINFSRTYYPTEINRASELYTDYKDINEVTNTLETLE